jgi:hypothetical protein
MRKSTGLADVGEIVLTGLHIATRSIFEPAIPIQSDMALFSQKEEEMVARRQGVAKPACRYERRDTLA